MTKPNSTATGSPTRQSLQRVNVTLEYDDGTFADVILTPVALVATERHFKGQPPAVEGTLFAAHYTLSKKAGETRTFVDWLESIVAVDESIADPTQAPPAAQ